MASFFRTAPGVDIGHVHRELLASVERAVRAAGGVGVYVTSGYRDPARNAAAGGVSRSNHLTGDALDGYALTADGRQVPLGTFLASSAGRFGLRSGDAPGFFHGQRDPVHVDDNANAGGASVSSSSGSFASVADQAKYIAAGAIRRGLDPAAVLAIASVEGLGKGVGDHGTSFGPFQLHQGGAYPASAPQDAKQAQAWANSQAGIDYALDRIKPIAGGLKGPAAITAIASRFERPANVGGEVSAASANYSKFAALIKFGFANDALFHNAGPDFWNNSPPGSIVSGVAGAAGGVVSSAEAVGSFLGKLTDASYILRGLQVIAGAVLVMAGLFLLARQVALAPDTPTGVVGKVASAAPAGGVE